METIREAIERLRAVGYTIDWQSTGEGRLRCIACGLTVEPSMVRIDEVVRFEGVSDPGDEAILFALSTDDGHQGIYTTAYGLDTPTRDLDVVAALDPRRP